MIILHVYLETRCVILQSRPSYFILNKMAEPGKIPYCSSSVLAVEVHTYYLYRKLSTSRSISSIFIYDRPFFNFRPMLFWAICDRLSHLGALLEHLSCFEVAICKMSEV